MIKHLKLQGDPDELKGSVYKFHQNTSIHASHSQIQISF